jgi:hypothetical protein
MQDKTDIICRICGQPKEPWLFCCPECWRRLPHEYRAAFSVAKLHALAWLRKHARLVQTPEKI